MPLSIWPTVPELFERARRTREVTFIERQEVEYDPTVGYPRRNSVVCERQIADCDQETTVRNLRAVGGGVGRRAGLSGPGNGEIVPGWVRIGRFIRSRGSVDDGAGAGGCTLRSASDARGAMGFPSRNDEAGSGTGGGGGAAVRGGIDRLMARDGPGPLIEARGKCLSGCGFQRGGGIVDWIARPGGRREFSRRGDDQCGWGMLRRPGERKFCAGRTDLAARDSPRPPGITHGAPASGTESAVQLGNTNDMNEGNPARHE
jgi:hypothetical protein